MDLNFLASLGKLTQALLAIAVIVVAVGVGVSFARYGTVSLNQKIAQLEQANSKTERQAIETREAILNDPHMKKESPILYETVKKHQAEDAINEQDYRNHKQVATIDDMYTLEFKIRQDEFGRFAERPVLTDEFWIAKDDPIQFPVTREQVGLAEGYILFFRYFPKIFASDNYRELLPYVYKIQPIYAEMITVYKQKEEQK